jgi:hypothetical protein
MWATNFSIIFPFQQAIDWPPEILFYNAVMTSTVSVMSLDFKQFISKLFLVGVCAKNDNDRLRAGIDPIGHLVDYIRRPHKPRVHQWQTSRKKPTSF